MNAGLNQIFLYCLDSVCYYLLNYNSFWTHFLLLLMKDSSLSGNLHLGLRRAFVAMAKYQKQYHL